LGTLVGKALAKLNVRPPDAPLFKPYVRYGSPGIVVERVTRTIDTDLLVLGTRGYSGAAYVFLGSVAGALLRGSRCDVLIVPPAPSREGAE
jgi:nucleotide-binding universal stress UspA family protein